MDLKADDANETKIVLTKPLSIGFPLKGNETAQKCISKGSSGWAPDMCKSTVIEDEITQTKSVSCSCKELSPTTVVEDLQSLLTDSPAAKAFSAEGLNALATVGFWKLYMFYVLSVKVVVFIILLSKGYVLDKLDIHRKSLTKSSSIASVLPVQS